MSDPVSPWRFANIFFVLASICLATYVLWLGASILQPIAIAGLVWFALVSVARLLHSIGPDFWGKTFLSHLLSWVILGLVAWVLVGTISATVVDFVAQIPDYGDQLTTRAIAVTQWAEAQATNMRALVMGQDVSDIQPVPAPRYPLNGKSAPGSPAPPTP